MVKGLKHHLVKRERSSRQAIKKAEISLYNKTEIKRALIPKG